jgi:hypothetical protein
VFTVIPLLIAACGDDSGDDDFASGGSRQGGAGGKASSKGGASASGGAAGGTSKGGRGGSTGAGGAITFGGSSTGGATSTGGSQSGGSTSGGTPGAEGGAAGAAGDAGAAGNPSGGSAGSDGGGSGAGGSDAGSGGEEVGGYGGTTGGGGADTGAGGDAAAGAGGDSTIVPDSLDNANFELPINPPETRGIVPGWTLMAPSVGQEVAWFVDWHTAGSGAPGSGNYHLAGWLDTEYTVTTSQVVTPLPDGEYTFSIYVNTEEAGFSSQYIFARGYSAADANALLQTDVTADNSEPNSYTLITLGPIPVTNGQCEVGIHLQGAANAWANFDDATLTKN